LFSTTYSDLPIGPTLIVRRKRGDPQVSHCLIIYLRETCRKVTISTLNIDNQTRLLAEFYAYMYYFYTDYVNILCTNDFSNVYCQ
ncbi:hypothetical protein L9F63_007065, partial [Diploptera punctata]